MIGHYIDRELLHFAYGFFLMESLWCLFFFMRRMHEKGKLPRKLAWLARKSYHAIYGQAALSILIGILFHELWDLSFDHNPAPKSWIDIGFWALGIGVDWFWNYRKWFYIVRWTQ